MSTFYLQLLDFPGNYEKGATPYGPRSYVAIKASSKKTWQSKSGKKKVEFTVISPECVSFIEFEQCVNDLIEELEQVKKKGKNLFAKENKRHA